MNKSQGVQRLKGHIQGVESQNNVRQRLWVSVDDIEERGCFEVI